MVCTARIAAVVTYARSQDSIISARGACGFLNATAALCAQLQADVVEYTAIYELIQGFSYHLMKAPRTSTYVFRNVGNVRIFEIISVFENVYSKILNLAIFGIDYPYL